MAGASAEMLWAGRYKVQRLLGEGERKQVYLACDERFGREVALALIAPEEPLEGGMTLTRWESEVTARLVNHPHVVTIFDYDECDGQTFMVSQYMRGGDLRGLLKRMRGDGRQLPLGDVLRYASHTADALAYAHGHEVIHRDVQPGNIWLDEPNGSAHLGDFDLAIAPGAPVELCSPDAVVTTRSYMPPEQARGEPADPRGDLYSLGAAIYELLVGRAPFDGTPQEIIDQHLSDPPRPPRSLRPEAPRQLENLVLRLLAKSPEERPATARDVFEALRAMADELTDDATDLVELISAGESGSVEFKQSLRYDAAAGARNPKLETAVAKTVAGFMNAQGGTLLIGVHDSGGIIGIEPDLRTLTSRPDFDGWQQAFTQCLVNHLGDDAAACVSLRLAHVPEGAVAVVRCRPRSVPTWVRTKDGEKLYTRLGNATRPLPESFARAYIEQNWPR
jgi:serine/threonine protein kinase